MGGITYILVPAEKLDEKAGEIAATLAVKSADSLTATKRLMSGCDAVLEQVGNLRVAPGQYRGAEGLHRLR